METSIPAVISFRAVRCLILIAALSKYAGYRLLASLFLLTFLTNVTFAQVSVNIAPRSQNSANVALFSGRVDQETLVLPNLNNATEIQNANTYKTTSCPDCRLTYYGKGIPVNVNLKGVAQVTRVPEGTVWILTVSSNTAKGFQLRFSEFDLPPGATLHLYSRNSSFKLGAYTSQNNNEDGRFFTSIFPENEMVIEYFEPTMTAYPGEVIIDTIIHLFLDPAATLPRVLGDGGGFATSGGCTVDAVCGDGNLNNKEAKAVGLISVYQDAGLTAWGTGFLINSTAAGGKKAYFMTAAHVMSDRSIVGGSTGYSEAIVSFHYQNSTCGTNDFNNPMWTAKSFQGMYLLSAGRTSQTDGKSDYSLWELQDNPRNYLQVAYLGWDKRNLAGVAAKPVYNISHPEGDALKVAVMDGPSTVVTFQQQPYKLAPDESALNVYVMSLSWTKGVTQPGSSGSPLLSAGKRVIGLLVGGDSRCSDSPGSGGALAGPDDFSRFAYAWDTPNPNTPALKSFLDPENTGVQYLDTYLSPVVTEPDPEDPDPGPTCTPQALTDPNSLKISLPDDSRKQFGHSTATSGNYLVVGAPGEGRAYVYRKNGCEISLVNTLSGTPTSGFGFSVGISGDMIAIGAPYVGSVYVFKNDGSDNFNLLTTIAGDFHAGFGFAVAIDGNQLMIGAPYGRDDYGMIYILEIASNGTWTQTYSRFGSFYMSGFGSAVDIKGNRAVAGAPFYGGRFINILTRTASGWVLDGTIDGDTYNSTTFGAQLALSDDGEDLIVSGPHTWHWRHNSNGTWTVRPLYVGNQVVGNTRISELVNNRIILIAHLYGKPTIWEKNSAGIFELVKIIDRPSGRKSTDLLIPSLGSDYFIVGSPEPSLDCTYSGSIYVYDMPMLFTEDKYICNGATAQGTTAGRDIYAGGANCAFSLTSGTTTFLANRTVILGAGFSAMNGSLFRASTVSCGGWTGTNMGGARIASGSLQEEVQEQLEAQPGEPVEETGEDAVVVYPSPSSNGILNIRSKDLEITGIVLYSTQGQEISGNTYLEKTGKFVVLKIPESFHGLCFIRVSTASRTITQKVFIK